MPPTTPPPDLLAVWAAARGLGLERYDSPEEVETLVLRGRGAAVFLDDCAATPEREALVRRLKADPSTAIVPVTILTRSARSDGEMVGVVRRPGPTK